tara:strand:- start:2215 stop:2910 length:696 start_codon:yes stop_codon:yes gene_type:complete
LEAIILAGGKGTRLKKVIKEIPKPLAPINGKPFLSYVMDNLIKNNINHFIISVGYKKEMIIDYYKKSYKGVKISYAIENNPLGTGGAILNSLSYCKTDYIYALNGDMYTDYNLNQLILKNNHLTMALIEYNDNDINRFGIVEIDKDYNIINFLEKDVSSKFNYINGGIYYINKKWYINEFSRLNKFSIEFDVFQKFNNYKFKGIPQKSYFIDIGIPKSYKKFINLIEKNKI